MNTTELIIKKRSGLTLTAEEINFFITGYLHSAIPSYQMSAFLMAVYFNGMSHQEMVLFTQTMLLSGKVFNLSEFAPRVVDKHSTGGVGDKLSLIVAPLAASCGLCVPMVSGRGLGHTGGTLDKLESIPGFSTTLSLTQCKKQLKKIGVCMIGQTEEFVPADKKLYALRDVTGTVESIPLISSSIMSKKIGEGIQGLVLDVKTGNGAFMQTKKEAQTLAKTMMSIGKSLGVRVTALITNMDQPHGFCIGNNLEVIESIEVLQGNGPRDVRTLSILLTAHMLYLGKKVRTIKQGIYHAQKNLDNGSAYTCFINLVQAQGGNTQYIIHPNTFKKSKTIKPVNALKTGYVHSIQTRELGLCSTLLGSGRLTVQDTIDHCSGIVLNKKIGSRVKKGEPLCIIHTNTTNYQTISNRIRNAFTIKPTKTKAIKLVHGVYGA